MSRVVWIDKSLSQLTPAQAADWETWLARHGLPSPRDIPLENELVDHVYARGCRSTLCVNPAHLEAVTPHENMLRQVTSTSAINRYKTHCIRGHEFTPENTGRDKKGRWCRTCNNDGQRERRRLRKQSAA